MMGMIKSSSRQVLPDEGLGTSAIDEYNSISGGMKSKFEREKQEDTQQAILNNMLKKTNIRSSFDFSDK